MQGVLQIGLGLVADTCFVMASKPPHTAKPSEIEKDKIHLIDLSISRVYLFSSVVVYGLAIAQNWSQWTTSGVIGRGKWLSAEWLGVAGMIFGGSLRLWCYKALGQFFTFNLAIRKGHRLITSGPYSLIRHPSYTGLIAMILGLSARYSASDSFLAPYLGPTFLRISFLWACVAPPLSLVKRIKQEEAMLEKEFGHEWKTYCQKTWRLIPFVW